MVSVNFDSTELSLLENLKDSLGLNSKASTIRAALALACQCKGLDGAHFGREIKRGRKPGTSGGQ